MSSKSGLNSSILSGIRYVFEAAALKFLLPLETGSTFL